MDKDPSATPSSPGSPEQLALRVKSGCRDSFALLFDRFEKPLYRFLLQSTGDPEQAEELAQATFVRAWRKIQSYDPRWKFSTWLFTIARNLFINESRERRSRPVAFAPLSLDARPFADGPDPYRAAVESEQRKDLWSLVGSLLSKDQKLALWLRYAEEMDAVEIAEVLNKRPVAVRVLLFRARRLLLAHLNRNGAPAEPPAANSYPRALRLSV